MSIASGVPFILPIIIDGTREPDALVPDRFRKVQWTRLPGGEVTPEVRARFLKLWSQRAGVVAQEVAQASSLPSDPSAGWKPALPRTEGVASPTIQKVGRTLRARLLWATAVVALLGAGGYFGYREYVARRAAEIRAVLGQAEPIKKESRVLVPRFENRSGEPALDLTGQLIADRIRQELPELDWVREAVTLPATEKVSADLTAADMSRLARKTGADALIAGAYHRQGDKVVLRGRVFDLARGKTWADLSPIEGPVADASAAVEEMAERLLGIASELGEALVREFPDNRAYRGFVGSCAARLGDTEAARAALTWLRAVDPKYRFGHHVFLQARIAALLGQRDDALRLLREAKAQFAAPVDGLNMVADNILLDPDFEPLATDPEFKGLFAPKG